MASFRFMHMILSEEFCILGYNAVQSVASHLCLHAGSFLCLFFDPEVGGNVGCPSTD
jgi:hypothetical protein